MSGEICGNSALDLKAIYDTPSEREGQKALDEVTARRQEEYLQAMKLRYDQLDD